MKVATKSMMALALFMFFGSNIESKAQASAASQASYKDLVGDNPNAEADMTVVSTYINALVGGELEKAQSLMAANYKGYGPATTDSTNREKVISEWRENNQVQANRKVSFVTQTFRVKSGNLEGDWVSLWGDYSFSQNGKEVTIPFQYTARVSNGKIATDRIYYDRLQVMQTLGFKISPPDQN